MAAHDQAIPEHSGHASPGNADWTAGPAKFAAVIVLSLAALLGAAASFRGRSEGLGGVAGADPVSIATGATLPDGRLDINLASAQELTLLPAIGPALAARIVADREENGPFTSVEDLRRVTGIGPRTLAKALPFVVARRDDAAHADREP